MAILGSAFITLLQVLFISNMESRTMNKTFTIGDQQVTCTVEEFKPALVIKNDSSKMNQSNAVNCSHLFYSFLVKGDIDGAAMISNDPEKVKEKFLRQKERAGDEEFKKMYIEYFTGKAKLKYIFTLGKNYMLIVHNEDLGMDLAQFYVDDGKNIIIDERSGAEKDLLGKIFQQLKDEEGNVVLK
jgi:hypothetical protein